MHTISLIAKKILKIPNVLFSNYSLIIQFTNREIIGRYKGSYLGLLWSLITPLLMLTIYTFVFSMVFNARWGENASDSKLEFALLLFAGLIIFNVFSEVVSRAPHLITSNVNFVKKVVFPLEILPIVSLASALFHAIISIGILLLFLLVFMKTFNWTVLFLPIVILPICLTALGLGWFLSSLGVYVRDIGQVIGVIIPALMFLSPIFYPISVVPKEVQFLYYINPISYAVEDMRKILIWGQYPDWKWLIIGTIIGLMTSILGYLWFQKTRGGFSDVL